MLLETIFIPYAEMYRCFENACLRKCHGCHRRVCPNERESTCIETMEHFAYAVVKVFGPKYLREPNAEDTARLLALGEARGFPGMLGSVDCMH